MKIKKIGHCCLLIQSNQLTILTDPGIFSVAQNSIKGIDVVLITHEHADHLHIDSLREIIRNNPVVRIVTNSGVGKLLDEQKIKHELLEGSGKLEIGNTLIEAFDGRHEEIFEEVGQVQNTGYFIDNTLFYPGDSFFNPQRPVDVLALPVAGSWCRVPDAIRYALTVRPKRVFPIHDGMLQKDRIGGHHKIPKQVLSENGIEFVVLGEGEEVDF